MATTKGNLTSFASIFPVDEAQKAAKRVEEAIADKQKELNLLKDFIADNTNLINLVSRLPDELHHDVMVPFGKAAFFPGRLVHTNEFVVLLGEGYYAERTAKQTVEILKRRGKALDSQADSLKANINDLRAEASFFDSTASEAAEGLVEIREDYVEESCGKEQSKSDEKKVAAEDDKYALIMSRLDELEKEELAAEDKKKVAVEDDEYARIMSRLDELEKEELAADGDSETDEDENAVNVESDNESNEDKHTFTDENDDESEEIEQANAAKKGGDIHEHSQTKAKFTYLPSQTHSETRKPQEHTKVEHATVEALSNKYCHQLDITDQHNCTGLTVEPLSKGDSLNSKSLTEMKKPIPSEKGISSFRKEAFTGSIVERPSDTNNSHNQAVTSSQTHSETLKPGFDSSKAFTGSIVERTLDLPTVPISQEQSGASSQLSNPQHSKPVSRFKMQRR